MEVSHETTAVLEAKCAVLEAKCAECRHEDKAGFAPGPWQQEPDRVEFEFAGFACLMHRGSLGSWCGYVAVPPGHPAYGMSNLDFLFVHGGVNYTSHCNGPICHTPAPGEPDDVWWIGFDCGHAWDVIPGLVALTPECGLFERAVYRDLAYVRSNVQFLAIQLDAMSEEGHGDATDTDAIERE